MKLTVEQCQAIEKRAIGQPHIPTGLGTEEEACSIAMINLALTGTLTDQIPDCMSPVVGQWIIGVQDNMPDAMRNSLGWRMLLPAAAGTGRDHEKERLDLIMEWMWATVLPTVQPIADKGGFGVQWAAMCEQRTEKAGDAAGDAAGAVARAVAGAVARAVARDAAWAAFSPIGLLTRLIAVSERGCE